MVLFKSANPLFRILTKLSMQPAPRTCLPVAYPRVGTPPHTSESRLPDYVTAGKDWTFLNGH